MKYQEVRMEKLIKSESGKYMVSMLVVESEFSPKIEVTIELCEWGTKKAIEREYQEFPKDDETEQYWTWGLAQLKEKVKR